MLVIRVGELGLGPRTLATGGAAVGLLVPLLAILSTAGCSEPGAAYAEEIAKRAVEGGTFSLPQTGAPVHPWAEAAVLCPYGAAEALPDDFLDLATKIDATSDDGAQWLFFRSRDGSELLRLNRDEIDFCSTDTVSGKVFDARAQWTVREHAGGWALVPAERA